MGLGLYLTNASPLFTRLSIFENYAELVTHRPTARTGERAYVRNTTGIRFVNRRVRGTYFFDSEWRLSDATTVLDENDLATIITSQRRDNVAVSERAVFDFGGGGGGGGTPVRRALDGYRNIDTQFIGNAYYRLKYNDTDYIVFRFDCDTELGTFSRQADRVGYDDDPTTLIYVNKDQL